MKVITVIPLSKVNFDEELTYFSSLPVAVGDVVEVSIRKKKLLGLVTGVNDARDSKIEIKNADFNLRKVESVKGKSILNQDFLLAATQFAEYTNLGKNSVLSYILPSILKENYDEFEEVANSIQPKENSNNDNLKPEKLLFQASPDERISYYKTLIRESFAAHKSIFIVLPREHEINLLASELGRGIENFVFTLHGGLSKNKALETIKKIYTCEHAILILATAPYLAIKRDDMRAIILEQEGSSAYRTVAESNLDLRPFIEIYATKIRTKLIMADTLLRFETIGRKDLSLLGEVRSLSYRVSNDVEIEVIEKGGKAENDNKWHPLTNTSLEKIKETLKKGQNVFVFTLRKGVATYTVCKHCETPVFCPECKAPLVLYTTKDKKKRMFVCNKCKHEKSPDTVCGNCGSWNLITLGIGTEMIYEELEKNFPETKIYELNKEVVKSKSSAEKLVKEFESSAGSILLGTEMALFYMTKNVSLSIMASFDSLWSIPNFKISEKVLSLILRTLERTEKTLRIETRNTTDEAITSFLNGNLSAYVKSELQDREQLGYPPYKRFIKLSWLPADKTAKKYLTEILEKYEPVVFGHNILLRIDPPRWSPSELLPGAMLDPEIKRILSQIPPSISIQVDPEDVL